MDLPLRAAVPQASSSEYRPAPLLPLVRRSIWVPFLLAVANGLFLYLLPGQALAHYAWPIKPPVNAAFLGAGYLSGVLATGLSLFAVRYWRSIWGLMWPFFVIGLVLLLATLLHRANFRWSYPLTWAWAAVYVIIPPTVVVLWRLQQDVPGEQPAPDPSLRWVSRFAWPTGVILAVVGSALLLAPARVATHWPWPISPLMGRAFSAWYLQMATTLLFVAATLRRPREAVIPFAWLATFNLLLLLLPLRFSGSMLTGRTAYWLWLLLHGVLLLGAAAVTVLTWQRLRREGERL